jgi:intracellular sulfur oxidation DsrE/DsrF family protein
MERRSFFKSVLAMTGLAAGVAGGGTAWAATATKKQKVVYHLSDAEKVPFVLSNIQNHIAGVGGPEYVEIVLVVHGPALKAFHQAVADPAVKQAIGNLKEEGVSLDACANTMKAQKVDEKGLLPGFVKVDQGGVVRIAQLQGDGYVYLRP